MTVYVECQMFVCSTWDIKSISFQLITIIAVFVRALKTISCERIPPGRGFNLIVLYRYQIGPIICLYLNTI